MTKFITNPGIAGVPVIETAGSNAQSVPHWKTFFTESYDTDHWGIFLNERWFSDGYINHNWTACTAGSCPAPLNPTTGLPDSNYPTVSSTSCRVNSIWMSADTST